MTEEKKLFSLIKSLSEEQVKTVSGDLRGARAKLPSLLFRRMLGLENWTEESRQIIWRGDRFTNVGKYHTYCKDLRRRIVHVLSMPDDIGFGLNYIQTAVELDNLELAVEKAWDCIQIAQERGDSRLLLLVLAKVQDLELEYRVRFDFPGEVPDIRSLREDFDQELQLGDLLVQVKKAFKENYESRLFAAARISEQVRGIRPIGSKSLFRKRKVAIGCKLLSRDLDSAVLLQQKLVDGMLKEQDAYAFSELVYEMNSLIWQLIQTRNREAISKYSFLLSSIFAEDQTMNRVQGYLNFSTLAYAAEFLPDLDLVMKSDEIYADASLESFRSLPKVYFSQALAYLYYEEFGKALEKFRELWQMPSKHIKEMEWEVALLMAICLWEKGEHAAIDSILESALNSANKRQESYPAIAVKSFTRVYAKANFEIDTSLIEEIRKGLTKSNESYSARFFDITLYYESKINGIKHYQLVANSTRSKHFHSRFVVEN